MKNYWVFKTDIIYTVSYTMSFYDKTNLLLSLKRNDSVHRTASDLAMTGFTAMGKNYPYQQIWINYPLRNMGQIFWAISLILAHLRLQSIVG